MGSILYHFLAWYLVCWNIHTLNTVDVLILVCTYFRGRLTPNQFAGINICASNKPENLRFFNTKLTVEICLKYTMICFKLNQELCFDKSYLTHCQ